MNRRHCLLAVLAIAVCCSTACTAVDTRTIYVLRHAETTGTGQDRALSEAGQARAREIAERIAPLEPALLLSSDYVRTRQTLAPLAERTGLAVETYDPGDLAALASRVDASGAPVIVIAGHSNTVRETVAAFGGEGGSAIHHDDYGRLYRVTVRGEAVETELSRTDR